MVLSAPVPWDMLVIHVKRIPMTVLLVPVSMEDFAKMDLKASPVNARQVFLDCAVKLISMNVPPTLALRLVLTSVIPW